jgi:hypothetical protein
MKILLRFLIFFIVTGLMVYFYVNRSAPIHAPGTPVAIDRRPNLSAIFNGNYQQWIDRFGTVSRSAFDASGKRIGTQVGHAGGPNGIVVEMTYLEPGTDHPLGQAFDGGGNPMPLHSGPRA